MLQCAAVFRRVNGGNGDKALNAGSLLMGSSFTVTQGLLVRELVVVFSGMVPHTRSQAGQCRGEGSL